MAKATGKRAMVQRRTTAINQMNEALRHQSDEVERLVDNEMAETITSHYQIGKVCQTVTDNPEKYGPNALQLLCDVHDMSKRTLQRNIRFVEYFPSQRDLDRLLEMIDDATGKRLQWAHIDALLTITDNEQLRWEFAQKAVVECLTPKQLLAKIKSRLKRSGGHGRPHAVPPTITAQLQQLLDMLTSVVEKSDQIWLGTPQGYSMWRTINELNAEGVTAELQQLIQSVAAKLEEVQAAIGQNAAQATRAETHVTGALQRQVEQQAAGEAASAPVAGVKRRQRRVSVA